MANQIDALLTDGLCECGCGQRTAIAKASDATRGYVRGRPVRFVNGHSTRKVDPNDLESSGLRTASGCLEWMFAKSPYGYGVVYLDGKIVPVHRHVMQKHVGRDLLHDEEVMHSCDNPPCFAIEHLSVGTKSDNAIDSFRKGRRAGIGSWMLRPEQVLDIRARLAAGESQRSIAALYSIDPGSVSRIKVGRSWGWLRALADGRGEG